MQSKIGRRQLFWIVGVKMTAMPSFGATHTDEEVCGIVAFIEKLPRTSPVRFLPVAYNWITRRRLFYWYAQLKALEASFDGPMDKHLSEKQAEIELIEEAVSHIRFPLTFSDQLYNLRSHIEIVRRKIASHGNAPGQVAAE
jgi:CRISPR/Cas system CMR subunit Cmr4 (Cas7 group RAMP superfamily)